MEAKRLGKTEQSKVGQGGGVEEKKMDEKGNIIL